MAAYTHITSETSNRILTVTINRPQSLNSLSIATIAELQDIFEKNWENREIGCVILTGAGEKAFVAGADINEINQLNGETGHTFSAKGLYLMKTIQNFPVPVIAAINGFALGGGCELAIACDIRLASDKAKLGQPEVNLGVMPGFGGTQRLPRIVGLSKSLQLILTGDMVSAQEAHRIGLVDEVYPSAELMTKARQMAETIASRGPLAVRLSKECIHRAFDVNLSSGCDMEKANFALTCASEDKTEGTRAFLDKRKASFKGR